jgi:glycerol-3-phosphate acyltransferase PlsY
MDWLLALVLGYALGSIPFGLLLARAAGKGDIRQVGSGNIGATNVLRTGSKGLAAAVLLLDAGKGFAAVWLTLSTLARGPSTVVEDGLIYGSCAALGAVLGHCFPVWLRFKGGKGVATALGVCLGLFWPIGLAYAAAWLGMMAMTRISSIGGMSAAVAAPVAAALLARPELVPTLAAIAVIVLWQHRANIARLRSGTEPRIGKKA